MQFFTFNVTFCKTFETATQILIFQRTHFALIANFKDLF